MYPSRKDKSIVTKQIGTAGGYRWKKAGTDYKGSLWII